MNHKEEFGAGIAQNAHFRIMHPYQSSEVIEFFAFTEQRASDYASEYKELFWFQKNSVVMGLGLDSSVVTQKVPIRRGS